MKIPVTLTAVTLALASVSNAGPSIKVDGGETNKISIRVNDFTWDTAVAGYNANIYWDANSNGSFGEMNENSGNSAASLSFTINITSGTTYIFAYQSFGGTATEGSATVSLTNSDSSKQTLTIDSKTPLKFKDSNGDSWLASFRHNREASGDVISNTQTAPTGDGLLDHQGTLTFTKLAAPSPSSAILTVGGIVLSLQNN